MLGLGWTEMLVIGVVALIVIGPKDLPIVMNRIGKIAGQIRRMGNEFQREINKSTGLDEVRNLRNSITAPLKKTSDEIRREFNAMSSTGVKPSGIIKPADPKAESVVDEIRAAAGIAPVPDPKPAVAASAVAAMPRKAPVKAKAAPTRPVIATDLKPVGEQAPVAAEPVSAPPKPARKSTRKPAAPKAAKPEAVKPEAAKPAAIADAAKPAPRKRTPKATTAKAGNE